MNSYMRNPQNGNRPPFEPFAPKSEPGGPTVIAGPKQTGLFRILQIKHGLKLELTGIRISRFGSLFAMVKREFGLKGNKQKIHDQFLKLADAILQGQIPLPGHPEQPHAWKGGRDIPPGTHAHHPEPMQNNPSEPTYEPEYGREERPFEGGWIETALKGLFQTFDLWRQATEREGDDRYAGDLALDIKRILLQMEERGIEPPPHLARKFDFIKKMFMSGAYTNNPNWPTVFEHENEGLVLRVHKALASVGIASKFDQRPTGTVYFVHIYGTSRELEARQIVRQVLGGRFASNPWLVAGPQVGFMDKPGGEIQQVDASVKQIEMGQQQHALPAPASDPSAPPEKVKRVLRPEEIERRRRSIRRQRRDKKTGKFNDNPGVEIYRPNYGRNPDDSGFIKISEYEKGDASISTFVKYDPSWQLFTVRHVEEREGKKTGFEVDIAAHNDEARRMWRFVKANGFTAFLKAMRKANRHIRAKRAYEETATQVVSGPPMGASTPTWGGVASRSYVAPVEQLPTESLPLGSSGWGHAPRTTPEEEMIQRALSFPPAPSSPPEESGYTPEDVEGRYETNPPCMNCGRRCIECARCKNDTYCRCIRMCPCGSRRSSEDEREDQAEADRRRHR
jgi:hypothetical protein